MSFVPIISAAACSDVCSCSPNPHSRPQRTNVGPLPPAEEEREEKKRKKKKRGVFTIVPRHAQHARSGAIHINLHRNIPDCGRCLDSRGCFFFHVGRSCRANLRLHIMTAFGSDRWEVRRTTRVARSAQGQTVCLCALNQRPLPRPPSTILCRLWGGGVKNKVY